MDCVGPLPRTKSGNEYFLTIMCTSTRVPEAIPLTLSQTMNFRLFQTERVCRRQFQI